MLRTKVLTLKRLWRQKSQDLIEAEPNHGCGCFEVLPILLHNVCNAGRQNSPLVKPHSLTDGCNIPTPNTLIYLCSNSFGIHHTLIT